MGKENESAELARLRGLGVWMCEVGATELTLGDLHIKLAPKPREAPARAQSPADVDEAKAVAAEAAELAKLSEEERAHRRYWKRMTRSSGAPIPPFRPREPRVTT